MTKLWGLCNILKDDGITYHQYVVELTYLLFLKMAKETSTEGQLPEGYRWNDLLAVYPFRGGDSYPFEALQSVPEQRSVTSWTSLSDPQN